MTSVQLPVLLAALLAATPPPGIAASGPAARAPGAPVPDTVPDGRPSAPMVQPGAPGEDARDFDADELRGLGGAAYTAADVRFMRGMISHHAQALEMTALVRAHATSDAVRRMALRMEISQRDEIGLMERWLGDRGHAAPAWKEAMEEGMARAMTRDGGSLMPGMLSSARMDELRAARGPAFDRLFLELMIQHHRGAIVMVRRLFSAEEAGQEADIFRFASHVDADQTAEIRRMRAVLKELR